MRSFAVGWRGTSRRDTIQKESTQISESVDRLVVMADAPRLPQLDTAFAFSCPQCGVRNFVEAVTCEFSPDDQVQIAVEIGEIPRTGEWDTYPDEVECVGCGTVYQTPGKTADTAENDNRR